MNAHTPRDSPSHVCHDLGAGVVHCFPDQSSLTADRLGGPAPPGADCLADRGRPCADSFAEIPFIATQTLSSPAIILGRVPCPAGPLPTESSIRCQSPPAAFPSPADRERPCVGPPGFIAARHRLHLSCGPGDAVQSLAKLSLMRHVANRPSR
jgi:hypothetical protein